MESQDGTEMVRSGDESPTHHTNQMKLFNAIAAAAPVGEIRYNKGDTYLL